jgi:hypothetical protein
LSTERRPGSRPRPRPRSPRRCGGKKWGEHMETHGKHVENMWKTMVKPW